MKLFLTIFLILLEIYICFSRTQIHTVPISNKGKIIDIQLRFSFMKCILFIIIDFLLFSHIY